MPRAVGGSRLRVKARQARDPGREVPAIRVAGARLLLQSIELAVQDRALKLAEAVVTSDDVMLVPHAAGDPAAVLNRSTGLGERIVIGRDDAAFARRQVLARLKRERGEVPERTGRTPVITCPVRMRGILDHDKIRAPARSP